MKQKNKLIKAEISCDNEHNKLKLKEIRTFIEI